MSQKQNTNKTNLLNNVTAFNDADVLLGCGEKNEINWKNKNCNLNRRNILRKIQTWQIHAVVCHQNESLVIDAEHIGKVTMKLANIFPLAIDAHVGIRFVIVEMLAEIDFYAKYFGIGHFAAAAGWIMRVCVCSQNDCADCTMSSCRMEFCLWMECEWLRLCRFDSSTLFISYPIGCDLNVSQMTQYYQRWQLQHKQMKAYTLVLYHFKNLKLLFLK